MSWDSFRALVIKGVSSSDLLGRKGEQSAQQGETSDHRLKNHSTLWWTSRRQNLTPQVKKSTFWKSWRYCQHGSRIRSRICFVHWSEMWKKNFSGPRVRVRVGVRVRVRGSGGLGLGLGKGVRVRWSGSPTCRSSAGRSACVCRRRSPQRTRLTAHGGRPSAGVRSPGCRPEPPSPRAGGRGGEREKS